VSIGVTQVADQAGVTLPHQRGAADVLEIVDVGYYALTRDWKFIYVNAYAERFWGRSRAELLGGNMLDLFDRFEGSPAHAAHIEAMRSGAPRIVETISTVTHAPVQLHFHPAPSGLAVFFRDITEQRALEAGIRQREELLTLAERSAEIGVWIADLKADRSRGTPQFFKLHGLEPTDGTIPMELARSVRHPEDRDRVTAAFRKTVAEGADTFEMEYRVILPGGETRWIFGRGLVTRDASGDPATYSGVDIDITQRKRQEEQVRLVLRELQHRTNNMLNVIQALARQASRSSTDVETFVGAFNARLAALAASNRLLVEQEWRGGPVADLVRRQLLAFIGDDQGRLELDGPEVMLGPEAVQNLGLALHELATNATKYGALSKPGGRISVRWRLGTVEDEAVLSLTWRESGGPPVAEPRRKGFGRFVSETMLAQSMNAKVRTEFVPSGLVWTAEIPATNLQGASARSILDRSDDLP
jgi:PAS domain S-box-containing protein